MGNRRREKKTKKSTREKGQKMDKYELVKDIGSGNFGVARLMRNKETKELVAMKYIERGLKVKFPSIPLFVVI